VSPEDVLAFWFAEAHKELWFEKHQAFDDELRRRFGEAVDPAGGGAFDDWAPTERGALALVILLDQVPRNIHRGSARAFAHDPKARAIARSAIAAQLDRRATLDERVFFYLPFEHSEDIADQELSVALFRAWAGEHPADRKADADDQLYYVLRHHEIISRFGRFPHRNRALDRASSTEELAFLTEPDSSF
jgi:uncharacterized protein (DUF924 family)